eukprot:4005570-Amphidinium_carterae.1
MALFPLCTDEVEQSVVKELRVSREATTHLETKQAYQHIVFNYRCKIPSLLEPPETPKQLKKKK